MTVAYSCFVVDAIHMTPIETVIRMRPDLKYLDDSDAKTKSASKRLDGDPSTEDRLRAVQVQFKKRETDEQMAARLSSFAYLQRKVEDEPWISLTHFTSASNEAQTVAERLIAESHSPIDFGPSEHIK